MFQDYLEVLLALDDGGDNVAEIAEMTGLQQRDVTRRLESLEESKFIHRSANDAWGLTKEGRRILKLGFDEYFKRVLYQKLGAEHQNVAA